MEAYRTSRGVAPLVLNLRSVWLASRHCRLIFREIAHGIHSLGIWVGPGVNLDAAEKAMSVTIPRSSSQYSYPYSGNCIAIILNLNKVLKNLSERIFSSDFYDTGPG